MFFIDGAYVSELEAKISVLDLGLLRGLGVFEYLRTYRGKPFHLKEHLLRLAYSASSVGLQLPYSLQEIEQIVTKILELSELPEASIKIVLTGGMSTDQFTPQQQCSFIVFAYPLVSADTHCYEKGVEVITTTHLRCLPLSKSTHYLPAIMALRQHNGNRPFEALYLNSHQEILEGTTSNFFGIKGNTLYTCASEEILFGVTREVVLNIATPLFPIHLRSVHKEEIAQLNEAFLTSSSKEIMPISSIDGKPIGTGQVGPVTRTLMQQFEQYTQQSTWPQLALPHYSQVHSTEVTYV